MLNSKLGFCLLLCLPSWAVDVPVAADACYPCSRSLSKAGDGFGTELTVTSSNNTFIRFDTSVLPSGILPSQIGKATLRVWARSVTTAGLVAVRSVGQSWTEASVDGGAAPMIVAGNLMTFSVGDSGVFVLVDVTNLVQQWVVTPSANYGLALLGIGSVHVDFDSKENTATGHEPVITIALSGTNGPAGVTGPLGPTGATGVAGPIGPSGPVGLTGATGAVGGTGLVGATGTQGLVGATGVTGTIGPAGLTGATGAVGGTGLAGATGTQGLVGATGVTGAIGPVGPTGATGVFGATGVVGATGPVGFTGTVGPTGVTGPAGASGYQAVISNATVTIIPGAHDSITLRCPSLSHRVMGGVGTTDNGEVTFARGAIANSTSSLPEGLIFDFRNNGPVPVTGVIAGSLFCAIFQ